jgi:hypothetical protein
MERTDSECGHMWRLDDPCRFCEIERLEAAILMEFPTVDDDGTGDIVYRLKKGCAELRSRAKRA